MPRVVVMHVRWPEGYFTDKYPLLVIPGYIYSAKGEPLTVYALEKIISFARENQCLFIANCVWWMAGIT
jgi:hypothetical protein